MTATTGSKPRMGRPPKDEDATPTRERILEAGAHAFAEQGFEATTLAEIAYRCNVSGPAIYNHFDNKAEVLVEVAKWTLLQMRDPASTPIEDPYAVAHRYAHPDSARVRRLILELHLASFRHEQVAELLGTWHVEHAQRLAEQRGSLAAEKMFFVVLMGLAQLDPLSALRVDEAEFAQLIDRVIAAIFPTTS